MILSRPILLALSLGACATTPTLPDLPPGHAARADAPETVPPPRTPTLGAIGAEPGERDTAPAQAPSRGGAHDAGSHR